MFPIFSDLKTTDIALSAIRVFLGYANRSCTIIGIQIKKFFYISAELWQHAR